MCSWREGWPILRTLLCFLQPTEIAVSVVNPAVFLREFSAVHPLSRFNPIHKSTMSDIATEVVVVDDTALESSPNIHEIAAETAKARSSSKATSVKWMIALTGSYMLVEFGVGWYTHSLALVGDAIHMLTDLAALVIGLVCISKSTKRAGKTYSFGYDRAEVIGGLINGTSVLVTAFFLVLEAVERFRNPLELRRPLLMTVVALIGLLINVIGIFLFHGHSHGGHGCSHGHSHGHEHHHHEHEHEHHHEHHDHDNHNSPKRIDSESMATHGMLLHIMGDLLGSVAALAAGAIMYFWDSEYAVYADPVCTVIIVFLITQTVRPLLRDSIRILMQTTPDSVNITTLKEAVASCENVVSVHDCHCWQFTSNKIIASCHIIVTSEEVIFKAIAEVRHKLHTLDIHSVTIQPEVGEGEGICFAAGHGCDHAEKMCCSESAPLT